MKQRIGRKNYEVFAFDTETHADDESVALGETGVWLACLINEQSREDDPSVYFSDLDSFLDRLSEMTEKPRRKHRKDTPAKCANVLIYDFNLAFEWAFLLPVMLKRGFVFKENFEKRDGMVFHSVSTKTCSSVWKAELKFHADGGTVVFRDLHKVFSGSLRQIAKSMGLPTQKGDIDYKVNRRHGWAVTEEERSYIFKDCRIIVDILLKLAGETGGERDAEFWSSVSAATYSCKKMVRHAWPKAHRPMLQYRKRYPILPKEEGDFVKRSVAGGLTYAPPRWQYVDVKGKIKHIDYHQSYPSSMASVRGELFPYGLGTYGKGKPPFSAYRMYCCHVKVSYSGVKLHSIVKLIGVDCIEGEELYVWDFELKTMARAYIDFRVEWIDYYEYRRGLLPFRHYFEENYAKRLEAKRNGDSFLVYLYKLLNNSCYGKFEENPHTFVFENIVDENGKIDSIRRDKEEEQYGAFSYYPVGSCISAYARSRLIDDALTLSPDGSEILYMDTDSLFYLDTPSTRKNAKKLLIGEELGYFGFEDDIQEAMFTAPKRYKLLLVDGRSDVKAGGVTLPPDVTFESANLVDGEFSARTHSRVKGGILIIDKPKILSVLPKYRSNYLNNGGKCYNSNE